MHQGVNPQVAKGGDHPIHAGSALEGPTYNIVRPQSDAEASASKISNLVTPINVTRTAPHVLSAHALNYNLCMPLVFAQSLLS